MTFTVFLLPTDVAKWVLDKQITRTPSGEITYNYELIDDFDSHVCTFVGPVGYLYHFLKEKRQNQVDSMNHGVNSQYSKVKVADSDSGKVESETPNIKPTKYETYNHMLYLMVSGHC